LWAPVFLPVDPEQISPYRHIAAIPAGVPVVIISGSADRHAPLDEVKALAARVRSGAKLVVFEGAVHEALDEKNPELYRATLLELLGRKAR
jgi:pimeloyl-ACP methyl ester carboxylesterase